MFGFKSKYNKKSILLLIVITVLLLYSSTVNRVGRYGKIGNELNFQEFNLNESQFDTKKLPKWEEQYLNVDQNQNGIDDKFEVRLEKLSEFGCIDEEKENFGDLNNIDDIFGIKRKATEKITVDDIPIIISFPKEDYDPSLLLFEDLGGKLKSTYITAINGFAGSISYDSLIEFCRLLQQNDIQFLVEEDRLYQAQLFYAGRNMNLRPYVWNTLSYDGDEYSSIAVIDTGLDDSHNFFSPGYSAGNFSYKIVGWRDEINGLITPYDDNGHGSHCSGISTGEGSPNYDVSGRSVATAAYNFNYTGGWVEPGIYEFNWARFNVTDPGLIELFCEFDDFTPGPDDVDFWVYLYNGETIVDLYEINSDSWSYTLSYNATNSSLGIYSFRFIMNLIDNTGDGWVSNFTSRFRSEIHWPFDPPLFGSGDPWKGVAPDAHLVGVKVLDQYGYGWTSDIVDGINWVIANRMVYNITTISMSLGGRGGDLAMINAVNNAVENGIVTVVAAGNSGPGGNFIGSPGDADNVITVAAMNINDEITDYSSQGGPSYTGNTVKPDITAPGGSFYNLQMFSTDTNDNDAYGGYPSDGYLNDMQGAQGTSMATPAVAGASNLLIEAMGGYESWGYTVTEAKRVKALLLMSATETYPLLRETFSPMYSPVLNRGGKDIHEGYGRLNIDIAIEAHAQELTLGSQFNAWITSSLNNSFNKHGLGCHANLVKGDSYIFTLNVPDGADFDLHLYSNNPSSIGEPIKIASSTSTGLGADEVISITAPETGKYYLIAKAISGEGNAIISHPILDHDLHVLLEVPTSPELDITYIVNATVVNTGINVETNVNLSLYLDGALVNSTSVSNLPVGATETINYMWTPMVYKTYNFTGYSPPVIGETIIENNIATELATIPTLKNYTMVPGNPYTWVDASGGTMLFLGDDDYAAISLPFEFQFYNQTFSTMYLSSNGYLSFTDKAPWYYYNIPFPSGYPLHTYMIAPFWADLYPPSGGHIYVQSFGNYWVAEWLDIYHIDGSLLGSFEAILYESGEIVFNYDYIDYIDPDNNYTCGLNLGVDMQYYNSYDGLSEFTEDFSIKFTTWFAELDHDLRVSLEVPPLPDVNNTYIINATTTNTGNNLESNVDLFLYLDGMLVNSTVISTLPIGASETINYVWNLTSYKIYNFTAHAPPVPEEPYIDNNLVTRLILVRKIALFDEMYINYTFSIFGYDMPALFAYYYDSGSIFNVEWVSDSSYLAYWNVDAHTRIMSNSWGGYRFGDGFHTPIWIFPDVSLGDEILIAVDAEGDHLFNVSGEFFYDKPGFGQVEVWELEDLSFPGGMAWYEKSTGILMNGTFFYFLGGNYNYTFEFESTGIYKPPPGYFYLYSNAEYPDNDGNFDLFWTAANRAVNYSVYQYSKFITEINGSLTHLASEITHLALPLSGYSDGIYYFIVVAHNENGDTMSNCIKVYVKAPITILYPISSSSWETGTSHSIFWTSTVIIYFVKIELYKPGMFEMEIISSTINDGEYSWTVPSHLADSDQYQIKITDTLNPTVYDFSDAFEIKRPSESRIPGYNLYIIMGVIGLISIIGAIGLLSIILAKRRIK